MRKQLRQLTGDTAIYGVTTIVQRFLSFLLTPFYTQFLLPEEFGVQVDLFVLIAFLIIVANAGMESAYFKFDSVATDEEGKRSAFWNAISVNWIVALSLGLLLFLFPAQINHLPILNLPEQYIYLIRMTGVILALDSMAMIPLGLLRMRRRAFKFGVIKIASIVVNVLLNVILVGFLDMKLEGIFIAAVAQSATQFLLTLPFARLMRPINIDAGLRRMMFRFGLPTIGSGISMISLQLIDRPIIKSIAGLDALGIYQASYRLGIVMVVLVSVFEFAWRPFFLQQASKPNAKELFSRIFTYFNLIAMGLLLVTAFYIPTIAAIPIPFTDSTFVAREFWGGFRIIPIVLGAYLFNGWYTNFIVGVYVEKKTSSLLVMAIIGAAIEAGLCFLLVPSLGFAGGAWATLAAYLAMAIGLFFYINRIYPIQYEWGRVGLILIGGAGLLIANLTLFDYYDLSVATTGFRTVLLAGFPVWLALTGFFSRSEIAELKRLTGMLKRRGK